MSRKIQVKIQEYKLRIEKAEIHAKAGVMDPLEKMTEILYCKSKIEAYQECLEMITEAIWM